MNHVCAEASTTGRMISPGIKSPQSDVSTDSNENVDIKFNVMLAIN
jgi:hypothetical protein